MIMAAICVMCMCAARQYPNLSYSKGVIAAAATIVIFSATLPAPLDNAAVIGFMICSLPFLLFRSQETLADYR